MKELNSDYQFWLEPVHRHISLRVPLKSTPAHRGLIAHRQLRTPALYPEISLRDCDSDLIPSIQLPHRLLSTWRLHQPNPAQRQPTSLLRTHPLQRSPDPWLINPPQQELRRLQDLAMLTSRVPLLINMLHLLLSQARSTTRSISVRHQHCSLSVAMQASVHPPQFTTVSLDRE